MAGLLVGVEDAVDHGDRGDDGEDPEDGRHDAPALEEGAEDDEDDALGALHKADFALTDESLGAGASVADHQRGDHDEGGEEDVEEAIAARVEDQKSEEEDDIGIAVDDGVKEGAEDGDLLGLAGDTSVNHVENAGADDDKAGIKKHANVVVLIAKAEQDRRAGIDDEAEEGEDVRRNAGEGKAVHDGLQDHATTGAERPGPRNLRFFAHYLPAWASAFVSS